MRYFIDTDIAEKYNLDDRKMNVYFGLCRLTYKQPWKRNDHEFARLFRFKSVSTVRRYINELITIGLIDVLEDGLLVVHHEPTVVHHEPSVVHHEPKSKEERTKEENNKYKKVCPSNDNARVIETADKGRTDGLSSFDSFWKKYNPQMQYYNRKKACFEYWNNPKKMPEEWKKLAIEKADCHLPETNPYFWLTEETFLKLDIIRQIKDNQADKRKNRKSDQTPQNGEDIWLSPEQQFECLQKGIALAVVYNPETDSYPTTTLQIATERGLKIHRKILC